MKTALVHTSQLRSHPYKVLLVSTALALSVALSVGIASQAQAQFSRSMTVIPPSVSVSVNPGESTEGILKIRNDSDEAMKFAASTQDYTVEDKNGIPSLLPPNVLSKQYSAAAWVGFSPTTFTVPAHEQIEVNYYVQTPRDARPGGHYTAVIYSPLGSGQTQGSGASVNQQIGTLFLINVKGDIKESAAIEKFTTPGFQEYAPAVTHLEIKNMGDSHIQPNGTITVKNMFGQNRFVIPLPAKNIFPGAVREQDIEIGKNSFMIGRYTATLSSKYGTANALALSSTISFWVFPWKIAVVIILIIVAGILGVVYNKRRKAMPKEDTMTDVPPVTAPEEQPKA